MKKDEKWNEHELKKAAKIILKAEKNKSTTIKVLDEIVHWLLLLVIIFGNVIIGVLIVFISRLLSMYIFYIVICVISVSFGVLIELVLQDINKIHKGKHTMSRLMLPVIAFLNIFLLIGIKNSVQHFSEIKFEFDPILVGVVYGIFLILPHLYAMTKK